MKRDSTSQLGYLALLSGKHSNRHFVDFSSRKSKQVGKYILDGEMHAFSDSFDSVFVIKNDLRKVYGK